MRFATKNIEIAFIPIWQLSAKRLSEQLCYCISFSNLRIITLKGGCIDLLKRVRHAKFDTVPKV